MLPEKPTYNHSRGDSDTTPCLLCEALQRINELQQKLDAYEYTIEQYKITLEIKKGIHDRVYLSTVDNVRRILETVLPKNITVLHVCKHIEGINI